VKRYRDRRALQDSVTQTPNNVTQTPENVTQDVTQYPAILYAITDPKKRLKIEKISQSLKARGLEKLVCYGHPAVGGVPFDVVGDLLDATK